MLLHRLALALGKTVGEIERTMSWRELVDWARFEALHQPLPDRLADLHFSVVESLMVNLTRSADASPVSPTDFLVLRDRSPALVDDVSEVDRQMKNWRGG